MPKRYQCPSCNGRGGWTDRILDDGTGPKEVCGYCNGHGDLTRAQFFRALGYVAASYRHRSAAKGGV